MNFTIRLDLLWLQCDFSLNYSAFPCLSMHSAHLEISGFWVKSIKLMGFLAYVGNCNESICSNDSHECGNLTLEIILPNNLLRIRNNTIIKSLNSNVNFHRKYLPTQIYEYKYYWREFHAQNKIALCCMTKRIKRRKYTNRRVAVSKLERSLCIDTSICLSNNE